MVNKVRKTLLALTLGILALSCYHIFFKGQVTVEDVALKALETGIDIEIENFEVVHEPKDGKKWELKADLAQINQEKDLTLLTNVELTIIKGQKQEFWVVADSGSIQNGSDDIHLDGHVKMVGASKMVQEHVGKEKTEPGR